MEEKEEEEDGKNKKAGYVYLYLSSPCQKEKLLTLNQFGRWRPFCRGGSSFVCCCCSFYISSQHLCFQTPYDFRLGHDFSACSNPMTKLSLPLLYGCHCSDALMAAVSLDIIREIELMKIMYSTTCPLAIKLLQ